MPLTKTQRDAWVARLRNPESKQAFLKGAELGGWSCRAAYNNLQGHEAMCCLVHGTFILKLDNEEYMESMIDAINDRSMVFKLERMNDVDRLSLPEIADYIEANIPTVEE